MKNTITWRGKEWDLDYKPPRLTQECIDTLYTNKQRRGIRELVTKYHTDHYELFRRFVIESGDVKFIKWFLTSSPDVYKDVIDKEGKTELAQSLKNGEKNIYKMPLNVDRLRELWQYNHQDWEVVGGVPGAVKAGGKGTIYTFQLRFKF